MSIGFHFDDIEEIYFLNKDNNKPIGAPIHDNDDMDYDKKIDTLPPIGAPYHD